MLEESEEDYRVIQAAFLFPYFFQLIEREEVMISGGQSKLKEREGNGMYSCRY